jgi:hypothetical protein
MWEHVKKHIYADPPRTVDDLVARLPVADTAVDTSILTLILLMWRIG